MISRTRTAFKFLTYGLLIGILFAPRSGKETRDGAVGWVTKTAKETLGL